MHFHKKKIEKPIKKSLKEHQTNKIYPKINKILIFFSYFCMRTKKENIKLMITPRRIWNWCKRVKHRSGFGVQSPTDYFFIRNVIYEKSPYYAYAELAKRKFDYYLPHYRTKIDRLLFRMANYFQPQTIIEVGLDNGEALTYMKSAKPSAHTIPIRSRNREKTLKLLDNGLATLETLGCLHIARTEFFREVFEKAAPYLNSDSYVVIADIHKDKERLIWWKELIEDNRTVITYDLYDIGIILFTEKRHKECYTVNFL